MCCISPKSQSPCSGPSFWALVVAVTCLARGAHAASDDAVNALNLPADPVLQMLIEQSRAALPELMQAQAAAKAERERAPQVTSLPDPMLQLGVQNDTFSRWSIGKTETSWYAVMVSQTLPWPGKLGLRGEVATLGVDRAEAAITRIRLSTEADVRRAYLKLLLTRDRLQLLALLEAISQKSIALSRVRYEAGGGAQSDVLRAQLELNRVTQRRWALQADVDTAVQALNRLRAHPLDEPIETAVRLSELPLPEAVGEAAATQDALARSPELAVAHIGVALGERASALAHKSYLPDFTVSAGVMPRGGDFPPMWLLNVSAPVPVFAGSKQHRAVTESEARVAAESSNVDAVEQVLRLRVRQRATALRALLDTARLYREGLLIQSEATAESTRAQYEVGNVTFASVLEANSGFIADQDGYLAVLAQAQTIAIDAAEVSLAPAPGPTAAELGSQPWMAPPTTVGTQSPGM